MDYKILGKDLKVSAVGLGCMGMPKIHFNKCYDIYLLYEYINMHSTLHPS